MAAQNVLNNYPVTSATSGFVSIRELVRLLVFVACTLCMMSPNPVAIWWRFVVRS